VLPVNSLLKNVSLVPPPELMLQIVYVHKDLSKKPTELLHVNPVPLDVLLVIHVIIVSLVLLEELTHQLVTVLMDGDPSVPPQTLVLNTVMLLAQVTSVLNVHTTVKLVLLLHGPVNVLPTELLTEMKIVTVQMDIMPLITKLTVHLVMFLVLLVKVVLYVVPLVVL
jgi:hypothetical protein